MHLAAFYFSCTHAHVISLIIKNGPIFTQTLQTKTRNFKMCFYSLIIFSLLQSTQNIRELALVYRPMFSSIKIQHIMRWTYFDVFRKNPKKFFLKQIYNALLLCKNCNYIKHFNNFSRCRKTIENIIQSIICKIIFHQQEPKLFGVTLFDW